MKLPESVQSHIEENLEDSLRSVKSVSGGSINEAAHLILQNSGDCFLKWNRTANPDMFAKEVKGLKILSNADTDLLIPDVLDCGETDDGTGYLLMEYITEGNPHKNSAGLFGSELARLHKHIRSKYGLNHDNYIGRLPQSNSLHDEWTTFFIEERMEPQLKTALESGRLSSNISRAFQAMYRRLPDIFPDEPASLLHGDLWGGNYFYNNDGQPAIFDPAVYYGNREIELAFTHLFRGFSPAFYDAYTSIMPLETDFEQRKDIYNLYPLLVHTNLFGGHYARRVQSIVTQFA